MGLSRRPLTPEEAELNRRRAIYITGLIGQKYKSQRNFCTLTGITRPTLRNFMLNGPEKMHYEVIMKIAISLDLDPITLLKEDSLLIKNYYYNKLFSAYTTLNRYGRAKLLEYCNDLIANEKNTIRAEELSTKETEIEKETVAPLHAVTYQDLIKDPIIAEHYERPLITKKYIDTLIDLTNIEINNQHESSLLKQERIKEIKEQAKLNTFTEDELISSFSPEELQAYYVEKVRKISKERTDERKKLKQLKAKQQKEIDRYEQQINDISNEKKELELSKREYEQQIRMQAKQQVKEEKKRLKTEYNEKIKVEREKLKEQTALEKERLKQQSELEKEKMKQEYAERLKRTQEKAKQRREKLEAETKQEKAELRAQLEIERKQIKERAKENERLLKTELKEKARNRREITTTKLKQLHEEKTITLKQSHEKKMEDLKNKVAEQKKQTKLQLQEEREYQKQLAHYRHYPGLRKEKSEENPNDKP